MQGYVKSQLKTIKQYFNERHSIILHKLKGEKKIEKKYYEENAPKNKMKSSIGNKYFTTSTPDISAIFDIQIPNNSNNSKNKKGAQ
jgi:hypothetical protein